MEAIEQKLEHLATQLEKLYSNSPPAEIQSISERIQSGQGFTSIKELSKYHGVCAATIYNWLNKGTLPAPIKIGGLVRFKNADLLAMEQSRES